MSEQNEYDLNFAKVQEEIDRVRDGKGLRELELATIEGRLAVADELEPLGADPALLECLRR